MKNDWEIKIKWNVKLFYFINSRRNKFLDKFYKYFYLMGKTYSLPVYLFLFYIFSGIESIKCLVVNLIITGILMPTIKYTFRHKRPSSLLENVILLEPVSLKSFPSADSAYVFTMFCTALLCGNLYLSIILLIIALIVGYGRVYMGAHFPLDVIVGYIFGFISALAGFYIVNHFLIEIWK